MKTSSSNKDHAPGHSSGFNELINLDVIYGEIAIDSAATLAKVIAPNDKKGAISVRQFDQNDFHFGKAHPYYAILNIGE